MADFRPPKRSQMQAEKPRRVRGGVRLSRGAKLPMELNWIGGRWIDLFRDHAESNQSAWLEAFEYARLGQTRTLSVESGKIEATVQGRKPRAYRTTIGFETYGHDQWENLVQAMVEQAIFSAKLLAGEMPENIEELFQSHGIRLFPSGTNELAIACNCDDGGAICKHVFCVALLVAERLMANPMLMFTLRGLEADDLTERLRQRRSLISTGGGQSTLHHVPAFDAQPDASRPLEEQLGEFWDAGPGLEQLEMPIDRPEVTHVLLRRLGPSPFEGKFPLLGLLATCYDTISHAVVKEVREGIEVDGTEPVPTPHDASPDRQDDVAA